MYRGFAALLLVPLLTRAQQEPVFRSGTRLVQVNVVVREKNAPVAGLTKGDFTLFENGTPRDIATFSVVTARGTGILSAAPPKHNSEFVTNRPAAAGGEIPTTATILLIDRMNTPIPDQRWATGKVIEFLEKHGAGERLGIYVLGPGLQVLQDLTDDPQRLLRAVARLRPRDAKRITADVKLDSTGDAQTDEMNAHALANLQDFVVADRVSATRSALEAISKHLANVPGRKNLIWVSTAFPLIIVRPHEVIDNSKDVDQAARALNDANIAVYPVDPRGLVGAGAYGYVQMPEQGGATRIPNIKPVSAAQPGLDTMNTLAKLTGGRAFYNTNGIEESMLEAVQDAQVTYVLGFYPPDDEFDDRFHKLTVRVSRRGAEIRSRSGYFASRTTALANPAPGDLRQVIADALDATEIGLSAGIRKDAENPGSYLIRCLVDLHDVHLEHANGHSTGTLLVGVYGEGNKTMWTITHQIDIPDDQLAAAMSEGVLISRSLPVNERTHEMRIAVQDVATGSAGSVRLTF